MVLDLMLGGDLRFHLDRNGFMAEENVRFIMAELAVALDYLHSKGIVHRWVSFPTTSFAPKLVVSVW